MLSFHREMRIRMPLMQWCAWHSRDLRTALAVHKDLGVVWPSTKDLNTHAKLLDFSAFKVLF